MCSQSVPYGVKRIFFEKGARESDPDRPLFITMSSAKSFMFLIARLVLVLGVLLCQVQPALALARNTYSLGKVSEVCRAEISSQIYVSLQRRVRLLTSLC
jgi:hypothetical protein